MTWTQISHTQLATDAKAAYDSNTLMLFHTWHHIGHLYWAAEHIYEFPYDLHLDRAILTHDVIYDALPLKELRSGKWLLDRCMEAGVEKSFAHIMRTANVQIEEDNRMILLDFARLRLGKEVVLSDREKILHETMAVTGCDEAEFSRSNIAFFSSVVTRFSEANLAPLPQWERQAFREIRDAMEFSIDHSQSLLKKVA